MPGMPGMLPLPPGPGTMPGQMPGQLALPPIPGQVPGQYPGQVPGQYPGQVPGQQFPGQLPPAPGQFPQGPAMTGVADAMQQSLLSQRRDLDEEDDDDLMPPPGFVYPRYPGIGGMHQPLGQPPLGAAARGTSTVPTTDPTEGAGALQALPKWMRDYVSVPTKPKRSAVRFMEFQKSREREARRQKGGAPLDNNAVELMQESSPSASQHKNTSQRSSQESSQETMMTTSQRQFPVNTSQSAPAESKPKPQLRNAFTKAL